MERHWGEVKDYDRDEAGAVIPNGVLRIHAPSLTGQYAIRVYPLPSGDVDKIPALGTTVAVYRLAGNAYCWTKEHRSGQLPAWLLAAGNYPRVAGFEDSTGAVQVAVDELKAMLGSTDATDPVVLASKIGPIVVLLADAMIAHTHLGVTTGAGITGVADAASITKATDAKTAINAGDHGAEKVVGV
jgi:hypothetical protein